MRTTGVMARRVGPHATNKEKRGHERNEAGQEAIPYRGGYVRNMFNPRSNIGIRDATKTSHAEVHTEGESQLSTPVCFQQIALLTEFLGIYLLSNSLPRRFQYAPKPVCCNCRLRDAHPFTSDTKQASPCYHSRDPSFLSCQSKQGLSRAYHCAKYDQDTVGTESIDSPAPYEWEDSIGDWQRECVWRIMSMWREEGSIIA